MAGRAEGVQCSVVHTPSTRRPSLPQPIDTSLALPTHTLHTWPRRPPSFCRAGRASYGRSASPREGACCAGRNVSRCAPVRRPSFTPPSSATPPPTAAIDSSGSSRNDPPFNRCALGSGWDGHASVARPPFNPTHRSLHSLPCGTHPTATLGLAQGGRRAVRWCESDR
jgi:hypothetical protein